MCRTRHTTLGKCTCRNLTHQQSQALFAAMHLQSMFGTILQCTEHRANGVGLEPFQVETCWVRKKIFEYLGLSQFHHCSPSPAGHVSIRETATCTNSYRMGGCGSLKGLECHFPICACGCIGLVKQWIWKVTLAYTCHQMI